MNIKVINRAFGLLAFALAFIVYSLTVQPTVPFWDCGEFSSAAIWQQVPHPPGTPLFLLIGKLFHIIIPFGDPGWKINMVSVVASAITIWLLYFIIVKTIINFREEKIVSLADALTVFGTAFLGAAAYTFSDTFWFNAVESEVYATSSLFVAVVVYLMMKWNEEADNPGHERYILLIAYLIGLSTGVHLLAILTIFSFAIIVYFRKYEFTWMSFFVMGIITVITFWVIYPGVVKYIPALFGGHFPMKNEAGEYIIEGNFVKYIALALIAFIIYLFYYGWKKKFELLKLITMSLLLMVFGYTTYTQILLRSNANPPMNENEPNDFTTLTSYLGREQYGEQRMWPRRTEYNDEVKMYYYNMKDQKGDYVYGQWFNPETKRVTKKDGTQTARVDYTNINFSGEIAYLWKYQIDHMFLRYFFWNFVGRESDVQDADEAWFDKANSEVMNYKSGYADLFPIRFYALPLILGLIGLFFHFNKDPKMALAFLVLFLLMGVLTAIAQNQQQPQPRERDYFYAGSFMVFSLWIGLGAYGLIEWWSKEKLKTSIAAIVLIIAFLLVPVNMAVGGWKLHSRAGNYLPFDYSYNILQSVEENAIVFTNGDNDTFPLWFLQDVVGVRRDVRIVNLSLANTLWYIHQLKNREPWGAEKIPLTFSDESLTVHESDDRALSYDFAEAREIIIPMSKELLAKFTDDQNLIEQQEMRFTFVGTPYYEHEGKTIYLIHVYNKVILDILQQTRLERPVYFSNTVGPDVFSGLGRYLRYEGMALRICPIETRFTKTGTVNKDIMEKSLLNIDISENFHKEQHYGFKLRNLDNSGVYYDEVHRRLMTHYRQLYMTFSAYSLEKLNDKEYAVKILDTLNKYISPIQFPLYYNEEIQMAMIYNECGATEQAKKFARYAVESTKEIFNNPNLRRGRVETLLDEVKGAVGTYKSASEAYKILGEYEQARDVLIELYNISKQYIERYGQSTETQDIQQSLLETLRYIASIDKDEIDSLTDIGEYDKAIAKAEELKKFYEDTQDDYLPLLGRYLDEDIRTIQALKDSSASAGN
jgi:tetratricopeptide (TPR) repeat protein